MFISSRFQDWQGIVFGDINGDWSPCGPVPPPAAPATDDAPGRATSRPGSIHRPVRRTSGGPSLSTFGFSSSAGGPFGGSTVVGLIVDDATGAEALDVVIYYTPSVGQPTSIALTPLTQGRDLVYNLGIPGEIHAGISGPPISGGGALLDITFDIVGESGSDMALDLQLAAIEESATVQSVLNDALFCNDGEAVLSWQDNGDALSWSVFGATAPAALLPVDLDDLGCLGRSLVPTVPDTEPIAVGDLSIYLIGAENCHGTSSLGAGSDNTSRPVPPNCP